jgi:hypothetical protein
VTQPDDFRRPQFGLAVITISSPLLLFGLMMTGGGILLCLTEFTGPPPAAPPARDRMRPALRWVAGIQFWSGIAVAAAWFAAAVGQVVTGGRHPGYLNDLMAALSFVLTTLGTSCLGGILWCAVRFAYRTDPPA